MSGPEGFTVRWSFGVPLTTVALVETGPDQTPANDLSTNGVATPVGIDSSPCSAPETSATPLSAMVGTPAAIPLVQPVDDCGCRAPVRDNPVGLVRYDVRDCPTAAQFG